jgi:hypothetical protein
VVIAYIVEYLIVFADHHKNIYQGGTSWFEAIFATGGNNIVEVFESLTTSLWTIDTPLFSTEYSPLGCFTCDACPLTRPYRVLSLYLYSTYLWWADYVSFVFWLIYTEYSPLICIHTWGKYYTNTGRVLCID